MLPIMRHVSSCLAAVALAWFAMPAQAQDTSETAVPISLETAGGAGGGHNLGEATVSISAPLGPYGGFQVDALGGGIGGTDALGLQGHAWYGGPAWGRAGISASRFGIGAAWGNRLGLEGEGWLGPVTLAVSGGKQNGHVDHLAFASASIRHYPTDDLMFSVGEAGWGAGRMTRLNAEWRPGILEALPGLTLFADGATGNHGYDHVLVGLRLRLDGNDKSLIRSHREDGVQSSLTDVIIQGYPVRRVDSPTASTGGGGGGAPPGPGGGAPGL